MTTINLDERRTRVLEKSIDAMAEFKATFGRGLSGDFVAELHAARVLQLRVVELNQPGYDALGEKGERYQIKYRNAATQNVDVNNFDFDFLVLVNLDEEYHLTGLWRVTVGQAREIFTHRADFRKYQATQRKIKSVGEAIHALPPKPQTNGSSPSPTAGRSWSEIRGQAAYPLQGEDAQQWVSRSRMEDRR